MKQVKYSKTIGSRQIHLDFHTSEYLEGIGKFFSKSKFQEALKLAHVDSINLFAKGHHSWSYYPTTVGRIHPNLDFDLLGEQIDACHEIGVLAHIYFTFGWSSNDAEQHPEWVVRDRNGLPVTSEPWPENQLDTDYKPSFQWKFLDPNSAYHDHVLAQVKELCERYPADGFWFDIYQAHRLSFSDSSLSKMRSLGVDVTNDESVRAFTANSIKSHCEEIRSLIQSYHSEANVFFNGTTAVEPDLNFKHRLYEPNTVQDLEDLPTVWGGYDKLPLQSKYFLKLGYPITAMSGKFHTAWGEFGGFKHPNALRYEAASMIAWGANCNFGDQLHPSGEMDVSTYKNIGEAYAYVKEIEAYGIGGLPVARLGMWRSYDNAHDEGLAKILLEGQVNFDLANHVEDLQDFDVIVIPGVACLDDVNAERLNGFVEQGGSLVVMGAGALSRDRKKIILDVGAVYLGEANFDTDYILLSDSLKESLLETPFLNFKPAIRMQAEEGVEVLATIREPYFSRTYKTYTSHQNTPYRLEDADHVGIIRKGNILYFANELDEMYYHHGARLHRDLFLRGLELVHRHPMVQTTLPSTGRVSLLHQADEKRYVVHLLFAAPSQRGNCEVIEDLVPLYEVPVRVDLPVQVQRATLIPAMQALALEKSADGVNVVVPVFSCHCAIAFDYE
tara:strand:- start:447 stop:2459 length:2013 start_codon:yes stop_codon:yes gene_type:complete